MSIKIFGKVLDRGREGQTEYTRTVKGPSKVILKDISKFKNIVLKK